MKKRSEPPFVIDSARVLMYAETGGRATYTGRVIVIPGNASKPLKPVPRLAICENLGRKGILIFHCNNSWKVLGAGSASSLDAALELMGRAYSGISSKWMKYRKLTSEEREEVKETRKRIRQSIRDYPLDGRDSHAV